MNESNGGSGWASSSLIAGLVHDLRTPLSGVLLNLELLEMHSAGLSDDDREDLSRARSSALELSEMIDTVVDVGRMEGGRFALDADRADLGELVRRAAERVNIPEDGPAVEVETEAELFVRCDRRHTMRAIGAFVRSAAWTTPEDMTVFVRARASDEWARVEVDDAGARIPARLRSEIFRTEGTIRAREEGFRRSSGLSLVLARLVVEAQGGRIGVAESGGVDAERGNTFWLELPTSGAVEP